MFVFSFHVGFIFSIFTIHLIYFCFLLPLLFILLPKILVCFTSIPDIIYHLQISQSFKFYHSQKYRNVLHLPSAIFLPGVLLSFCLPVHGSLVLQHRLDSSLFWLSFDLKPTYQDHAGLLCTVLSGFPPHLLSLHGSQWHEGLLEIMKLRILAISTTNCLTLCNIISLSFTFQAF